MNDQTARETDFISNIKNHLKGMGATSVDVIDGSPHVGTPVADGFSKMKWVSVVGNLDGKKLCIPLWIEA